MLSVAVGTIVTIVIACVFGMGYEIGTHQERMAWNQKIKAGALPVHDEIELLKRRIQ